MPPPTITGIHFVGSVPLPNEETTLRTLAKSLPTQTRYLPDGEPAPRNFFARWQVDLFKREPLVLNPILGHGHPVHEQGVAAPAEPGLPSQQELERLCATFEGTIETGYDKAALSSWEIFRRLRDEEGVIPKGVRFQVGLPTPLTVAAFMIRPSLRGQMERYYEEAILRTIRNIEKVVPAQDLAIQFDSVGEILMLEGAEFLGEQKPWFEGDVFEGMVERFARLVDMVGEGVDVGVHLCYGDAPAKNGSGGKHVVEPVDLGLTTLLALGIAKKAKRRVDWVHMPVPKSRSDKDFFKPLASASDIKPTRLVLGLVHADDLEGTRARAAAAGEFLDAFDITTECGMGRLPPDQLDNVLQTCASLCEGVQKY